MLNDLFDFYFTDLKNKYNIWKSKKVYKIWMIILVILFILSLIFISMLVYYYKNKVLLISLVGEVSITFGIVYLISKYQTRYLKNQHKIIANWRNWEQIVREEKKNDFVKYMKDQNISFDSLDVLTAYCDEYLMYLKKNVLLKSGIFGVLLVPIWIEIVNKVFNMGSLILSTIVSLLLAAIVISFYYISTALGEALQDFLFPEFSKWVRFRNLIYRINTENKMMNM